MPNQNDPNEGGPSINRDTNEKLRELERNEARENDRAQGLGEGGKSVFDRNSEAIDRAERRGDVGKDD